MFTSLLLLATLEGMAFIFKCVIMMFVLVRTITMSKYVIEPKLWFMQ